MKKLFILAFVSALLLSKEILAQSVLISPNNINSRQNSNTDNLTLQGTNPPNIVGIRHDGTLAAPTATGSGDFPLSIEARGHNGTAFTSAKGRINFETTQIWGAAANGVKIDFYTTANSTTSMIKRMTINHDGNVGIGITTPSKKLHVFNGASGVSSFVSSSNFLIEDNTSHYIQMGSPEAQETGVLFGKPSNSASGGIIYNASNGLNLRTGGNLNRMTITSDGNVGIGTITPNAKMNLVGGNFLIETSSTDKILLKQDGTGSAGEALLYTNTGLKSVEIRGSDVTGAAGEINFYVPSTQVRTIEIDGDYGSTGKSRIIVDELQIKGGSDLAEFFKINTAMRLEAGTVVSVSDDNSGNLELTKNAYDKKVVGIISGANGVSTGLMLHQKGNEIVDGDYPIAINGRVYVKAEATKYPIKAGDLLTSSDIDGYAMKSTNNKKAHGAVIGKALTGLDKETGLVLVLLGVK